MIEVFLGSVLPIFAVAGVGYFYGRVGILGSDMAMQLNRFVFYFALPVLLFKLLASVSLAQFEWGMVLGYFLAELALYVGGYFVARYGFKRGALESLLIGMTGGFVNHVMFVLPIAQQLFGDAASVPIVAIITLDAVVMFGGTIIILEVATNRKDSFSFWSTAKLLAINPQLIAMFFGVLAMIFEVRLNSGFAVFAQFVGDAAAPASLFALGIVLAGQKFSDFGVAATFSGVKLIIMPLITWAIVVGLFQITPNWAKPALLVAAGPTGAMAFVLALQYGVRVSTIALIVLFTTVGSVVSVSLMSQLF